MAGPSGADLWNSGASGAGLPPAPTTTVGGVTTISPASGATVVFGGAPAGIDPKAWKKASPKEKEKIRKAAAAGLVGHRGFLDSFGHGVISTAEEAGTGLYELGKSAVAPGTHPSWGQLGQEWSNILHGDLGELGREQDPLKSNIGAMVRGTASDLRHPLRHPFNTALDVAAIASLGAGSGFRLAAASRAAKIAEATGETSKAKAIAGALLQNPALTTERTLTIPGSGGAATARGIYSRSGLGMGAQKLSDLALQRGAKVSTLPRVGERAENILHRRAAKWDTRAEKAVQVQLKASGKRVAALGRKAKLTEPQNRALRIVAEGIPYERQVAATEARIVQAERDYAEAEAKLANEDLGPRQRKTAEKELRIAKDSLDAHEARLQWTHDAADYLTEDAAGRPILHPDETQLQEVYAAMEKAAGSREGLLHGADLMDDEQFRNALVKQARMAAGARYVKPTPGRLGNIKGYHETVKRVAKLEARFQKRIERTPAVGYGAVARPRTAEEAAARLDDLEREKHKMLDAMAEGRFGPVDMSEVRLRNIENAKARRQAAGVTRTGRRSGASGLKAKMRPNVKDERRNLVEREIAASLERNPDHPTLQRWRARDEEIDQLRGALTPDPEEAFGGAPTIPKDFGTISEFRSAHPSVERLGSALSVARDELERLKARREAMMMPTGLVGAEDVVPGRSAIFVGNPTQPPRFGITGRVSSSKTFGHTRKRGSLKAATGRARQLGMERNDVTELLAERQHEAVGLSSLKRAVDRVKPAGTRIPRRPDDVFVWTDGDVVSSARVHPDVRRFLDGEHPADPLEGEVLREGGAAEAMRNAIFQLPEKGRAAIGDRVLKPSWDMDATERERLEAAAEAGQGVFVPRRLLGERIAQQPWKLNPKLKTGADVINNAGRLSLIYLKINYPLVQGLSNIALNLVQQGVFAPANLKAAATLGRNLGGDVSAMVDDAVEQGFAGEIGFRGAGSGNAFGRGTQKVAHYAGVIADKMPRRAAWLHEARRQGYTSPDEIRDLLTNPEKVGDLAQVTQRAKEAIVDFGDLGPAEREFVRNLVFVYPWLKGSTYYAGRFLRDHPLQAAVLGALGERGAEINQETFGDRPTYMHNVIPVGGGRAIDLASLNPFSTPAEIARTGVGIIRGQTSVASEPAVTYASPALSLISQLATNRDEGGFPLKGNVAAKIRQIELTQTPLSQLLAAYVPGATSVLGKPIPSKSFPDQNQLLRFILGGLSPREYDTAAIHRAASFQSSGR